MTENTNTKHFTKEEIEKEIAFLSSSISMHKHNTAAMLKYLLEERYSREEIEKVIILFSERRSIAMLQQLLTDRDKLLRVAKIYAELEEMADTYGEIAIKKGNNTAREAIKGMAGDE